jgi:hypothetical protein
MPRCGFDPELASISHLNEKSKKMGWAPEMPTPLQSRRSTNPYTLRPLLPTNHRDQPEEARTEQRHR